MPDADGSRNRWHQRLRSEHDRLISLDENRLIKIFVKGEVEPSRRNRDFRIMPQRRYVAARDRDQNAPTADQQKMNSSDREITKKIRMAIHQDKSLSTYAHNIKVIAQNGVVTLKGPVRTEQEKQSIEAKAAEAAGGADKVKSEIEVTGKS